MGDGGPALTVLIDARNVLRSQWPNIPEQELVDLCRSWAEARDVRAFVAFDGDAPGGFVGEEELAPHCVLVGTGAESADDWLVRAAAKLQAADQPFWLVTSDRGLRARAGEGAKKVVGGGSFASELTSGGWASSRRSRRGARRCR
jgi:predicted RNA-binding protein with PIN domain